MSEYPGDFVRPQDDGGPGQGQLVGGFGGNPAVDQAAHRAAVQRVGKAPVLLVHGNSGEAATPPWDLVDAKRMLLAAGYVEELIWAPSYLGPGVLDLLTPHTNNVNDLRSYLDTVCDYLAVDVVDVIAHSLGCSLTYAVCRGLEKQTAPVNWNQPKRWHRIGTFVALAGAFHGLGANSVGEWQTRGEFMTELLDEDLGGGGENPFGADKEQTPPPRPHHITYFCGIAQGDFIDAQNPGTGRLDGAINRSYSLGLGRTGHERIKENQGVFNDFLPHLNSVPPVPAVKLNVDRDTGSYPSPLQVTVAVDPPERAVEATADRITKAFLAGTITNKVSTSQRATLRDGQQWTIPSSGMWQLTLRVDGAADDLTRTYWVDVPAVVTTINTDNATPFTHSLVVTASANEPTATIYYSLDGTLWNTGATVTIDEDATVSFVAITPAGLASEIVSRSFHKVVRESVTASANEHFIAGRIDVTEYLRYSAQFGFFTPFTLYRVDGEWLPAPERALLPPELAAAPEARDDLAGGRPAITVREGDPQPGRHRGSLTVTLEAAPEVDAPVHYSRDGSIPTGSSASFSGSASFDIPDPGNHLITCATTGADGTVSYHSFCYSTAP